MKYGWENIYDLVRSKQLIVTAAAANDEIHCFKFQLSLENQVLDSVCSVFVMMLFLVGRIGYIPNNRAISVSNGSASISGIKMWLML